MGGVVANREPGSYIHIYNYIYIYVLLLQSFENLPTTHRHIADTHNFLNSQQVGKPGVHSF